LNPRRCAAAAPGEVSRARALLLAGGAAGLGATDCWAAAAAAAREGVPAQVWGEAAEGGGGGLVPTTLAVVEEGAGRDHVAALEQARPPPPHLLLFAASAAAAAAAARDGRREGESDPGGEYGRVKAGTGGVGLASRAAALPWQAPPAVSMSAAPLVCVRVCARLCARAFVFLLLNADRA
jgi:hypothetical protein